MKKKIKSIDELNGLLQPLIMEAMNMTGEFIVKKLQEKVENYYNEYDPEQYDRTDELRYNSYSLHRAKREGSVISMKVGFDDDYLQFHYRNDPVATGLFVVRSMNEGYHGWKVYIGHHYWDELLDELGQEEGIKKLFKQNLKKCGVPVK